MLFNWKLNRYEVELARLSAWEKLTRGERKLVEESFPVLYGLRTSRADKLHSKEGQQFPVNSHLKS